MPAAAGTIKGRYTAISWPCGPCEPWPKPPCRIKFLYDGEEEIGSPNLPAFLRQHRERFRGDVMVIADGPMHPSGRPTVSLGVRGVMMLEMRLPDRQPEPALWPLWECGPQCCLGPDPAPHHYA